ncbi:TIGR03663 family protein [Halorussus salilacus]|uniref:flippase activity-associated protein Agl23 n=1 Tax=Halorussus salilacus TaxID=2953750 RepID=UPI00209F81C9|nr:flippase activity-associated protein Agl23 [Halorussus salilacus]USZ67151.1 TIGR03663 family protein [Halorussus salilacus]
MASETESPVSTRKARETLTGYASRAELAVVGVTLFALAVRFVGLGTRIAHQDEARVAYWAARYLETGVYEYRPIVHGPFPQIVNGNLFGVLGPSDFTMRLVVAVLSGLFPLVALLLRDRLRGSEMVALALLLAVNPVVLYYSRFYRNDVLLAGFMLTAFAFYVRAYDTRKARHLYLGTAAFALAFTTKENALVYPVCWAGAAVLLWDHRLLVERAGDRGVLGLLREDIANRLRGLAHWVPHLALAAVEFLAIVVFFYAPRNTDRLADNDTPGLYEALGNPLLLPAVVEEALVGSWDAFAGQWGSGSEDSYLTMFMDLVPAYVEGASVLLVLALAGFVVDRYADSRPRDVVAFATYWGAFSILGYPVIVSNPFPWEVLHAVVPLVVPAAVGLALVARLGLASAVDGDAVAATAAALVLLVVAAQVGATAYATSFESPQSDDSDLVQYAQSSSEMKPLLGEMQTVVEANGGIDVLYYGEDLAGEESSHDVPPAGSGWFERLPFAWYMEAYDAETDSTDRADLLGNMDEKPPIVIALGETDTCSDPYDSAADIDQHMDGYDRHEVDRFLHDSGCTVSSVVVYVDEDAPRE